MRQFKLINKNGAEFDLMREDAFFAYPEGLGIEMDNTYVQIGDTYDLILEKSKQKEVSGNIYFKSYEAYSEFVKFISAKPLILCYKPLDEWYMMECTVTSLTKQEISVSTGYVHSSVTFTGHNKWYAPKVYSNMYTGKVNPKEYGYDFNYTYVDSINGRFEITNDSTEESPTILTILGAAHSPFWELYKNGVKIRSGKFRNQVNIAEGNKLVINSTDGGRRIAEFTIQNELVKDLYQDIDFDTNRYLMIPPGKYVLLVSDEDPATSLSVQLEVYEYYDTV